MEKLLFSELTYKLIGIAYKIDNEIGFGQSEKIYSDAFERLLEKEGIEFKKEHYAPITVDEEIIAKRFFDFLIENKIIIEFKQDVKKYRDACTQLFKYLKSSGYKLGLIIRFTKHGVKIKRIPNLY